MTKDLHELLAYDADTGALTWRVHRGGRAAAGSRAGCADPRGYRLISAAGQQHWEHRLVWFFVHGEWPALEIDHINGDRGDNRIANLRLATRSQQNMNRPGVAGVAYDSSRNKWMAHIREDGRMKNLGRFASRDEALAVRRAAETRVFGDFAARRAA